MYFNDLYKKLNQPNSVLSAANQLFIATGNEKSEETFNDSISISQKTPTSSTSISGYQGNFCSYLGWIIDQAGAKRLWTTSLRTPYMMKLSPAYLTGYLVYKSRIQVDLAAFESVDYSPTKQNCLEIFETSANYLLCPENFTIPSRYSSYIATWNTGQKFSIN